MPIQDIKLRPGVEVEATPTLNSSGISSSQLIRFKDGLPQKYGGWEKFYNNAVSGIPRALHGWGDLAQDNRLAVGTVGATSFLGTVDTDGGLTDLTPQTLTTNPTIDFSTTSGSAVVEIVDAGIADVTTNDAVFFNTPVVIGGLVLHGLYSIDNILGTDTYSITANANATSTVGNSGAVPAFTTSVGSAVVTVTITAHGLAIGNRLTFPITTSVGGVDIIGTYTVLTVPTANTFTIGVATQAASAATVSMNSGAAQLVYYLNLGPPPAGAGFGLGPFGSGGFGVGVSPASQTGDPIVATDWSIENWGEFMVACPFGGGIYYWPPNRGYQNAFVIPSAPAFNGGIYISMPAQIMVAWGSTSAAPLTTTYNASPEQRDPLIVRWSDTEDFFNWQVTSLTQAGSYRLSSGSRIVGGMQGPKFGYLWTDLGLWTQEYLGAGLVFSHVEQATGCGLVGQHAAAALSSVVYWMSAGGFFTVSGAGVTPLPCSVWDIVFQDLDVTNAGKVCCAANSLYNEVAWFYPSLADGTGENTRYVKYNAVEKVWDYGTLSRSAWIDQTVLGNPIGATSDGLIYQHETGNDADTQPMTSWFETGYAMLDGKEEFAFVDKFYPDMKWGLFGGSQNANLMVTLTAVDYPNGTETVYAPFTITQSVKYADPRIRGRALKFRVESSDLGSFWRFGNPQYRWRPDGKR